MKNEVRYYSRMIDSELENWAKSKDFKPVLLHGARQTGKSSAVRNLAKKFELAKMIFVKPQQQTVEEK